MSGRQFGRIILFIAFALIGATLYGHSGWAQTSRANPEGATDAPMVTTRGAQDMVVAAHPLAVQAGRDILRDGGTALDAAIAVQMVLGLVEPQSSGLGGGGFLLYWDAAAQKLHTYDGRERAPLAADGDHFVGLDGALMRWNDAVPTAASVGVPGLVAMLEKAHQAHGKRPWPLLFDDAISLARDGFGMSPRLNISLARFGAQAFDQAGRKLYFDEDAKALPLGTIIRNPSYAKSLGLIAKLGGAGFYDGDIARAILDRLAEAPLADRAINAEDLAQYQAKERQPVCVGYRDKTVCGMGPPSSGGLTVGQTLAILEHFPLENGPTRAALHLIAEAEKLSYADRNRYIADTDFVPIPEAYLDESYLGERAASIDQHKASGKASPGDMRLAKAAQYGVDVTYEARGTSHISVVDTQGNAVSMTTSIETAFGSRMIAAGFFLNNQLTDFSFAARDAQGIPIANRPGPGKRPRSSMAPTMVFDGEGLPWAVVGSPGGSRIILYVVKALVGLIDWDMDPAEAVSLGNFGSRNGPVEIEAGAMHDGLAAAIDGLGHEIARPSMTSGLAVIRITEQGLQGAADPRREGSAEGNE